MAKDEEGARPRAGEPSYNDPKDPRWSQNPHAAGPRNPYLDMPLDGPPVGGTPDHRGYGFAGQQAGRPTGYPGQHGQQGHSPQNPQPGYPPPGYPVQQQPAGALAIVSLVAGIVGVVTGGMLFIPQIVAVICGHMALRREPHMRAIAIAGLVTGYLMLGLTLVGFLFLVTVFSATMGSF